MFFKVTLVEEDEKVIAHKVQSEVNSSMLFLSVQEYLDCFFFFTFLEEERSFFFIKDYSDYNFRDGKVCKKLLKMNSRLFQESENVNEDNNYLSYVTLA